jgi:DNA repair protein RecN (Recombination protein N)
LGHARVIIALESLRINNFALVEKASLEIGTDFNVITGETGAGKSILVGALSMVLGEWVGKEIVRAGEEACEVEASFSGDMTAEIENFLEERDLGADDLILRRKFFSKGKSKCYINDRHITLTTLKELGNLLIDIHSQNQHQALLKTSNQMKILDRFAGAEGLLKEINVLWKEYNRLLAEQDEKINAKTLTENEIDQIRSEISEINGAGLHEGIDDEIEKDYKIYSNSGTLYSSLKEIFGYLYENDGAIMEKLSESADTLKDLAEIDNSLEDVYSSMQKAAIEVENACDSIRSYINEADFDPARMEEVLELRQKLVELKRKYGNSVEAILEYRDEITTKISEYENFDGIIKEIGEKVKASKDKLNYSASELTAKRKKAAKQLEKSVMKKLNILGMKDAEFKVKLQPGNMGPNGQETVGFFINPKCLLLNQLLRIVIIYRYLFLMKLIPE